MDVKLVSYDDWKQLFIDGICVYENHSISPDELLGALGIKYKSYYVEIDDHDGYTPRNFFEFKDLGWINEE